MFVVAGVFMETGGNAIEFLSGGRWVSGSDSKLGVPPKHPDEESLATRLGEL